MINYRVMKGWGIEMEVNNLEDAVRIAHEIEIMDYVREDMFPGVSYWVDWPKNVWDIT